MGPPLRREIAAMQQSLLETLKQQVAADNLLGVYIRLLAESLG